jgi:hypothetical protein
MGSNLYPDVWGVKSRFLTISPPLAELRTASLEERPSALRTASLEEHFVLKLGDAREIFTFSRSLFQLLVP